MVVSQKPLICSDCLYHPLTSASHFLFLLYYLLRYLQEQYYESLSLFNPSRSPARYALVKHTGVTDSASLLLEGTSPKPLIGAALLCLMRILIITMSSWPSVDTVCWRYTHCSFFSTTLLQSDQSHSSVLFFVFNAKLAYCVQYLLLKTSVRKQYVTCNKHLQSLYATLLVTSSFDLFFLVCRTVQCPF